MSGVGKDYWVQRIEPYASEDARNAYETDYARIIHSASFRRLQGKTQILNLGDSDFYRTRLTHTLEVSQLAGSMFRELEKRYKNDADKLSVLEDKSLIQTIGLIHDLGHPPFGHGGEYALNYCMRDHGGFEGNGQTLRILSRLEKFSASAGANLTYRSLLGCLKYPISYGQAFNIDAVKNQHKSEVAGEPVVDYVNPAASGAVLLNLDQCRPPKCYLDTEKDIVQKILAGLSANDQALFFTFEERIGKHNRAVYKSFDCSLMDLADDISNGIHDLEDAISLKLITSGEFADRITPDEAKVYTDYLLGKYPKEYNSNTVYDKWVKQIFGTDSAERKHQISRLTGFMINDVRMVEQNENFDESLLKYKAVLSEQQMRFVNALKAFIYDFVIQSPSVQHLEFNGQQMVVETFNTIAHDPKRFLPKPSYDSYKNQGEDLRVICDHVAGMTDNYLRSLYERLYSPRVGSVFDHL